MIKWLLLLLPLAAFTKDFGRMGQTFPVEEESFLEFMQRTISGEKLDQKMLKAKEVLLEKAKNPVPIKGLSNAKKPRSFLLDLSYKVEKDIQDLKGIVIAKAGTRINPLEKMQLSTGLLFLDGDQEDQLAWARKQEGEFKWILVKGKPFDVEDREKRPIYFDQGGKYVSRFRIENIPAKIVQEGKFLLVQEVTLSSP